MPPLPELIPQPAQHNMHGTTASVDSSLSHLTSSTYYNVTEEEMMKSLLKQVYTTEIQSKCKFLPDPVLHKYNHDDKKHISQVILNGIGVDPSSPREDREEKWAKLSPYVKQLMQDHRSQLTQRLKHKYIEGKHLYWR